MTLLKNGLSDYAFTDEKYYGIIQRRDILDCHLSKNHINISYHLMMEVHEYYNLVLLPDEYSMIEDHFG